MDIFSMVGVPIYETRDLDLGDYVEGYRGAVFKVWVTPTTAHIDRLGEIAKFMADAREKATEEAQKDDVDSSVIEAIISQWEDMMLSWYADTWINFSLGEARRIRDALKENNPDAWDWLLTTTHQVIQSFRSSKLKNSVGG